MRHESPARRLCHRAHRVRAPWIALATLAVVAEAAAQAVQALPPAPRCAEAAMVETAESGLQRYAFRAPPSAPAGGETVTLVLLPGGSGHVDLNEEGCPRALAGNSLVRSIPLFAAAGFGTALVDAPAAYRGEDGLGGYRVTAAHAEDLGRLIARLRERTRGSVWVIGTSRGAISAANAASRLAGAAAPDGVVLTSALMSGQAGARKAWVAQSVFDLPLETLRLPLLVVGHAEDNCVRSPPALMDRLAERSAAVRRQVVLLTGGPGHAGMAGTAACEGRSPHGYIDQEEEVVAGIARFIRGGRY